MEDNFTTFGFDNMNVGIERYINDMRKTAKAAQMVRNDFGRTPLDSLPLTMAYVPMQSLGDKYTEEVALKNGTLFPELDKPFLGRRI